MATNELGGILSIANQTPILVLHTLWERANAAYNAVDEASPSSNSDDSSERVKHSWFNDGTKQIHAHAGHLQLAILNEIPRNKIDAAILSGHICTYGTAIDTLAEKYREEGFAALDRALASLFVFMSSQVSYQFDGWMDGTLRQAKREIVLREGKPEAWDSLREAA